MCIFNPWYQISGRLENRFAKQAEIRFLRPTIYWQMMRKSIRRITRVLKLCVYLFWKKNLSYNLSLFTVHKEQLCDEEFVQFYCTSRSSEKYNIT